VDVDIKLDFRRRGVHVEGMRKSQAFRIKLGRGNTLRVGSTVSKV
jgi:hypothetical protein